MSKEVLAGNAATALMRSRGGGALDDMPSAPVARGAKEFGNYMGPPSRFMQKDFTKYAEVS